MTREEAIQKYILPAVHHHWNEKVCNKIEQILKQEPCEDCISREALERELNAQYAVKAISAETIIDILNHLPSVQPTRPHGEWILKQRGPYVDIVCSKCGYAGVKEYAYNYTVNEVEKDGDYKNITASMCFCENCGADMRGE